MKTLANCTPREFLTQTVKIRHAVEKWLTDTDIMNIRKTVSEIPDNATEEEREKAVREQARINIGRMYDAIAEKHPDETAELLALLCFIDPKDVDKYPMSDYFAAVSELISNEAVIGFFSSVLRLVQTNIFNQ